jgi:hypothetical protein
VEGEESPGRCWLDADLLENSWPARIPLPLEGPLNIGHKETPSNADPAANQLVSRASLQPEDGHSSGPSASAARSQLVLSEAELSHEEFYQAGNDDKKACSGPTVCSDENNLGKVRDERTKGSLIEETFPGVAAKEENLNTGHKCEATSGVDAAVEDGVVFGAAGDAGVRSATPESGCVADTRRGQDTIGQKKAAGRQTLRQGLGG